MRSFTPPDMRGRCPRCFLPRVACICPRIPTVQTATRFLIVRHILEFWKTTNTARLAAMALPNATLAEFGRPHETLLRPAGLGSAWLLFPDAGPAPKKPPDCVVVLDGTWAQARRMLQRIPWLRGIPQVSLLPSAPVDGLRRAPHRTAMSTLTAIARAVELLEGPAPAALLDELHADFVAQVRALRGDPTRHSLRFQRS
jgi:DTW domain-containing protein